VLVGRVKSGAGWFKGGWEPPKALASGIKAKNARITAIKKLKS
jgi:hypothetical protein